MKILTIAAVAIVITAGVPIAAAEVHQQHQPADHMQLTLDHGRKWATDKPLRDGMVQIRASMADSLQQIHQGKLSAEQYRSLGATIQQQVSTIIAQCNLEPRADAMLHIVLADLLAGADAMQGKGGTEPAAGAERVITALNAYGNYFNHPGWRSLP